MNIDIWISFVFAASILCFTPGPTAFLVMAQSLHHGKKSVIPVVTGVLCGDLLAMCISFAGLGALLATSAVAFNAFKWVAAGYLIYLGGKAWFTDTTPAALCAPEKNRGTLFMEACVVTALNPKGIIFFVAFFPLFMNTNKPLFPQMLALGVTFLVVSCLSAACYAGGSGYLRSRVTSAKFQRVFHKMSGTVFIGAGVVTASLQKSGG